MKIGLVDLDTSHPECWIPIERELGHEVACVWGGGSIHPKEYTAGFATQWGIPRVCDTLHEMAQSVDCAVLHGCDWDTRIEKARPFVDAGKAILLDKPIAGNLQDLRQITEWADKGVRITGGSALRFCGEVKKYLVQPIETRGTPHTVFCGCAVDEYNYGIHAYALLSAIMGPGIQSVQHLGRGIQRRVKVGWEDGRMGFLVIGQAQTWLPFYACITTECANTMLPIDHTQLYQSFLEAALPYLAGETDEPPLPIGQLIEPELAALAARRSWLENDCEVRLDSLTLDDSGYDGDEFFRFYKQQKYPVTPAH